MVSLPYVPGVSYDVGAQPDPESWISASAQQHGVPRDVLRGVLNHESSLDVTSARKPDFGNGGGLAQAIESSAASYGTSQAELRANPSKAVDVAARILKDNAAMFGGDYQKAAAAYFVGPGTVQDAEREGGSNWLEAADRMAEKYQQGKVSDYLAAALGGASPAPASSGPGTVGGTTLSTLPASALRGLEPVSSSPGYMYDQGGFNAKQSALARMLEPVPQNEGAAGNSGGFDGLVAQRTGYEPSGFAPDAASGMGGGGGGGTAPRVIDLQDIANGLGGHGTDVFNTAKDIFETKIPYADQVTQGVKFQLQAPWDFITKPVLDKFGVNTDAADPYVNAATGFGASAAVPQTLGDAAMQVGPGEFVKGANKLRGLVTGVKAADKAALELRGLEKVPGMLGIVPQNEQDLQKALNVMQDLQAAKKAGNTAEVERLTAIMKGAQADDAAARVAESAATGQAYRDANKVRNTAGALAERMQTPPTDGIMDAAKLEPTARIRVSGIGPKTSYNRVWVDPAGEMWSVASGKAHPSALAEGVGMGAALERGWVRVGLDRGVNGGQVLYAEGATQKAVDRAIEKALQALPAGRLGSTTVDAGVTNPRNLSETVNHVRQSAKEWLDARPKLPPSLANPVGAVGNAERMGTPPGAMGIVPGERPKTSWTITPKNGEAYQVETKAGAVSSSVEEAQARLARNTAAQDALNQGIRNDQRATGAAPGIIEGSGAIPQGARELATASNMELIGKEFPETPEEIAKVLSAESARIAANGTPTPAQEWWVTALKVAKDAGDPVSTLRRIQQGDGQPDTGNAAVRQQQQPALPGMAPPTASQPVNPLKELMGVLGGMRTGFASGDMPVMRQGGTLAWFNKKVTLDAFKKGVEAYVSEGAATASKAAREADPLYQQAIADGLRFHDAGVNAVNRSANFTGLNDSYFSRAMQQLPWIKNSERATAEFINGQAFEVYKQWTEPMRQAGISDPKRYEAITEVINHAVGHSGSDLAKKVSALNVLFSSEYTFSRFNVLADPIIQLRRGNPEAAKLAAQNLLGVVGGNASLMTLLALTGQSTGRWSVNLNPTSGDFGQLRIGSTRYDTMAGFGPLFKTTARIAESGLTADDWEQATVEIAHDISKYFENKEAPVVKMFTDAAWNRKAPDPKEAALMYVPGLASGVVEAVMGNNSLSDKAVNAIGAAIPGFGSVGVNTYKTPEDELNAAAKALGGNSFAELSLPQKLKALDQVPDEAQRQAKQIVRKDLKAAQTAAGYDDPSAIKSLLDRKNPQIDVQEWALDRGTLSSIQAIDLALQSGIEGRDVRLAGLKRAVNQDENSRKAWEASKKPLDWYLNDVVPQNADKFIAEYAKGKDGAVWRKADGTPLKLEQLPKELRDKVTTEIRRQALDPEMEAWLVWWGQRDKPKTDTPNGKKVDAEYEKITAKYGRKDPETLKKAVLAGIKASVD